MSCLRSSKPSSVVSASSPKSRLPSPQPRWSLQRVVSELDSRRATLREKRNDSRRGSFHSGALIFLVLSLSLMSLGQSQAQDRSLQGPPLQTKTTYPALAPGGHSVTVTESQLPPSKSTGWRPNRKSADSFAAKMVPLYGDQVAELVRVADDRDALNWRFLAACLGHRAREQIPSADQDGVGSCVGYGTARAGDVVAACDILHRRERERFVPWNPDAVYAIGRQRANQLGNWDGSSGSWSIAGIKELGTLHYIEYEGFDLENTRPQDGKAWAARGIPAKLLAFAADHKVGAAFRVTKTDEFKAALQNGYAGIICANIGYSSQRDNDGFARRQGQWAHCMAVIAYRGRNSGREGFLVSNSWGDDWIRGPVWPEDQPHGSFWIGPQDLQAHLNEGDSWIIAGYEGFRARDLSWSEIFSRLGGGREDGGETARTTGPLRASGDNWSFLKLAVAPGIN